MRAIAVVTAALVALAGCMGDDKAANEAPKASLKIKCAALVCTLNATGSSDPDGDPLTYTYRWAGGVVTTNDRIHNLTVPASLGGDTGYKVSLVVRDGRGGAGATHADMLLGTGVNHPPEVKLPSRLARVLRPGGELLLNATQTSDETPSTTRFEWIVGPKRNFDANATPEDDPCKTPDTRFQTFSTGCFAEGTRNVTLSEPGIYTIHCHPHPWMQGRIVVDPTMPAAPAKVTIRDFAYEPDLLRVGPGSVVAFENLDPMVHTATVLDYSPGLQSVEGRVLKRTMPQAGDYIVRLIVTDGHGGRSTQTWGVRVAESAPRQPEVTYVNATQPLAPMQVNDTELVLPGPARVNATLQWLDPSGQIEPELRIGRGEAVTPETGCGATRGSGERRNTTAFDCVVAGPGTFTIRIDPDKATQDKYVLHDWKLVVRSWAYLSPGFGDTCLMAMVEVGEAHQHGC